MTLEEILQSEIFDELKDLQLGIFVETKDLAAVKKNHPEAEITELQKDPGVEMTKLLKDPGAERRNIPEIVMRNLEETLKEGQNGRYSPEIDPLRKS